LQAADFLANLTYNHMLDDGEKIGTAATLAAVGKVYIKQTQRKGAKFSEALLEAGFD
jgi:hypothetical protein